MLDDGVAQLVGEAEVGVDLGERALVLLVDGGQLRRETGVVGPARGGGAPVRRYASPHRLVSEKRTRMQRASASRGTALRGIGR